ncbi:hypothetical protein PRIPAC_73581 [Pristionchus pacificus]|uniref:Uncharacterized protein n=1 Tax=Pristionchus pacificus TaxID=54126 RepID=A0A2A6CAP0_PRIPA|nr:hypothetical protein PRIPAC_73581 [Pristionchus pacificus]|eukprot:PDM75091.1 hypothetical protein PRIPAC_40472 [Pristionchus pacificus]
MELTRGPPSPPFFHSLPSFFSLQWSEQEACPSLFLLLPTALLFLTTSLYEEANKRPLFSSPPFSSLFSLWSEQESTPLLYRSIGTLFISRALSEKRGMNKEGQATTRLYSVIVFPPLPSLYDGPNGSISSSMEESLHFAGVSHLRWKNLFISREERRGEEKRGEERRREEREEREEKRGRERK